MKKIKAFLKPKTKIDYLVTILLLLMFNLAIWVTVAQETNDLINKVLDPLFPQPVEVRVVPLSELPVEAQICRVFGRKDCKMALAISQAENGLRTCDRVSSTGDIGIFQINEYYHGHRGDLYDCTENIQIAKQIFDEQGWTPWVAYNNKSYIKFL